MNRKEEKEDLLYCTPWLGWGGLKREEKNVCIRKLAQNL